MFRRSVLGCVLSGYNACFQLPGANLYNNADLFLYIDVSF